MLITRRELFYIPSLYAPKGMRAAVYHRYGPPEAVRIQDVPRPVPKDNEVLVRVRASTVCAADWRCRKADPYVVRIMNGLFKPKKMPILGMEFSGTVESVGKSVTRFRHGDEVFGGTGFKLGCHAEYVCVEEDKGVAVKPSNIPLEEEPWTSSKWNICACATGRRWRCAT